MTLELALTTAVSSLTVAVINLYYRETRMHNECRRDNKMLLEKIFSLERDVRKLKREQNGID